jgi:Holliday junction resolvase RusA-like endonuclease
MEGQRHQGRPDRDNLLKAFQDAFDGDDGFVWDGRTTKVWGRIGHIVVTQEVEDGRVS